MEPDRYKQNSKLFIVGIISLLISLSLIIFALYILPFFIWHLHYNVPEFLSYWLDNLTSEYQLSEAASSALIFLLFFVLGIIFGVISYMCSNHIEEEMYVEQLHPEEAEQKEQSEESEFVQDMNRRRQRAETFGLLFKMIFLILLVIGGIWVLEWLFIG